MAQHLITSSSLMISNIFCSRSTSIVRCFRIVKSPMVIQRCNNYSTLQSKSSTFKSQPTPFVTQTRQSKCENYHEIDTNITNNVLLWQYDNMKYFRKLRIFAVLQAIVASASSYTMYSYLPTLDKYLTLKEYMVDNMLILTAAMLPIMMIVSSTILIWYFETRSLKYIILNKGGKMTTLVTFHPWKGSKTVVVPVENVMINKSRHDQHHYMSLKVLDPPSRYIIDGHGRYLNPQLFDLTVGALKSHIVLTKPIRTN